MITHVYKNNNFTVRREPRYDPPAPDTLGGLVEAVANDIDAPDVHDIEECYPGWCVVFLVNGAPRRYMVMHGDLERFARNLTVRFVYDSDAPLFSLPTHYDAVRTEHGGRKGTLYKLCDREIDGDRISEMTACGCTPFIVRAEYAPEIARIGIFVPDGTCFEFE